MIYEMRTYTLCPGGVQPWLQLYESEALPVLEKYGDMTLVGYFRVETGVLNRLVHIWSYPDLEARARTHQGMGQDEEWLSRFVLPARQYLVSQESVLLSPVGFSPLQ